MTLLVRDEFYDYIQSKQQHNWSNLYCKKKKNTEVAKDKNNYLETSTTIK